MRPALDELLAVLHAEVDHLRRLVPLLQTEQAALLRADAREVGALAGDKERAASELKRLEVRRVASLGRLAAELGLGPERVTLSRLTTLLPASDALAQVRAQLRAELARLADLNARNRALIDQSLACLRGVLDRVRTALADVPTYGAAGTAGPAVALPVIDRRA
jgi:flagellar biosynthesis/type III secretory pathway chaperone